MSEGARSKLWEAAGRAPRPDILEWLLQQGIEPDTGGAALDSAAASGNRVLCEWLLAHGWRLSLSSALSALWAGEQALMDWLLQQQGPRSAAVLHTLMACDPCNELTSNTLYAAAFSCGLPTLQRFHQHVLDVPRGPNAPTHLPMIKFVMSATEFATSRDGVLAGAAVSPTPDWRAKVEWLEEQGYRRLSGITKYVVEQSPDARERLEWLLPRGYHADQSAVTAAASAGNTAALQFLLAEGIPPTFDAARAAAQGGKLTALKALCAVGCPMDAAVLPCDAAQHGHLHVLSWLVEELGLEVALGVDLFGSAALSGSVELMAWLRQRGCHWDASVFKAAAQNGCVVALEWLAERGCPMPEDGTPFMRPAKEHDTDTLECLVRLGCPWGPVDSLFTACVAGGCDIHTLSWLREHGCPVDWDRALQAARGALLKRWLREHKAREEEEEEDRREKRLLTACVVSATALALPALAVAVIVWLRKRNT